MVLKKKNVSEPNLLERLPNIPSFISFVMRLKKILKDCETVLDVGCGALSPVRFIKAEKLGADGYGPAIKEAQRRRTHDHYKLLRAQDIKKHFPPKSFDAVVALDLIEHLPKKEGYKLIRDMENIALKKVVIFTPNGFLPQKSRNDNLQEHLSGWSAGEMQDLGFKAIGVYGPKILRGGYHIPRFRPKIVWGVISFLSDHFYTPHHPDKAAALLCIKKVGP